MFKAKLVNYFGIFGSGNNLSDEEYDVMPSNIRNMQVINKNQTLIQVKNIKGIKLKDFLVIDKELDVIYNEIIDLNGENLGDFKIPLDSTSFGAIPYIELRREQDGTTHKSFCMVCGFTRQVYHTQRCGCRIKPKFEGKVSKDSITKQSVCINKLESDDLGLKYNKFDENWSLRSVYNIVFDDTGMALGQIKIKNQEINVVSDSFKQRLSPKKGEWHTL